MTFLTVCNHLYNTQVKFCLLPLIYYLICFIRAQLKCEHSTVLHISSYSNKSLFIACHNLLLLLLLFVWLFSSLRFSIFAALFFNPGWRNGVTSFHCLTRPQSSLFGSYVEDGARKAWPKGAKGVMGRKKTKGETRVRRDVVSPLSSFPSPFALHLTSFLSFQSIYRRLGDDWERVNARMIDKNKRGPGNKVTEAPSKLSHS